MPLAIAAMIIMTLSDLSGHLFVLGAPWCQRNESCWPTPVDVARLVAALDPSANRSLFWSGGSAPLVCAVPEGSPDNQPLFGAGLALSAVYDDAGHRRQATQTCFEPFYNPFVSPMCLQSTRNNPLEAWQPSFVVWPLTAAHIRTAIAFAVNHSLCVMVTATGHDFLNRHSCPDGVMIRTSLMKEMALVAPDAFRFGPGIVFSEAHHFAGLHNRSMASGWAPTVGIVGWSLGGGHGPMAPSLGLGVDNIVEVTLVDAQMNARIVNATSHGDLFWALRGGGGSTWGVVTSMVVRAHPVPSGGYTRVVLQWNGTLCGVSFVTFRTLLDEFVRWTSELDFRWAGTTNFVSMPSFFTSDCPATWQVNVSYAFQGPPTDQDFVTGIANLTDRIPPNVEPPRILAYPTWWDAVAQMEMLTIVPTAFLPATPSYVGAVPSVLVNRSSWQQRGAMHLSRIVSLCNESIMLCGLQQLCHDLTGNVGSPRPPLRSTPLSDGMREGIVHLIGGGIFNDSIVDEWFYSLGENSYFSESAYRMREWGGRYWGAQNHVKLRAIKRKYDPQGLFYCRHCVGDE